MAKRRLRGPNGRQTPNTALRRRVILLGKDVWRLTQANSHLSAENSRIDVCALALHAALRDLLAIYDEGLWPNGDMSQPSRHQRLIRYAS